MTALQLLTQFDAAVRKRGTSFEAVVVGDAALTLLGVVSRPLTRCSVLAPWIPREVAEVAVQFAAAHRGERLAPDWLSNEANEIAAPLPTAWRHHLRPLFAGAAVRLWCLGRLDLLRLELLALCKQGRGLENCVALKPSATELHQVEPWLLEHDLRQPEVWKARVTQALRDIEDAARHPPQ